MINPSCEVWYCPRDAKFRRWHGLAGWMQISIEEMIKLGLLTTVTSVEAPEVTT